MRPPRVRMVTFLPCNRCIYTTGFGQYWTSFCYANSSAPQLPSMQFPFVGSGFCRRFPSDSASRRTPLSLANSSYCQVCSGLSPPSYTPMPGAHKKNVQHKLNVFLPVGPVLPGSDIPSQILRPSIICAEGLNCCVRDGNRWDPFAIAARTSDLSFLLNTVAVSSVCSVTYSSTLPHIHLRPISSDSRLSSVRTLVTCLVLNKKSCVTFSCDLSQFSFKDAIVLIPENCIDNFLHNLVSIRIVWSSPRPISTGQLNTLLHLHLRPIYLVFFQGPYFLRMGNLILELTSRLDAFSVYSFQT